MIEYLKYHLVNSYKLLAFKPVQRFFNIIIIVVEWYREEKEDMCPLVANSFTRLLLLTFIIIIILYRSCNHSKITLCLLYQFKFYTNRIV